MLFKGLQLLKIDILERVPHPILVCSGTRFLFFLISVKMGKLES
jgi:hypothetical protein